MRNYVYRRPYDYAVRVQLAPQALRRAIPVVLVPVDPSGPNSGQKAGRRGRYLRPMVNI